METYVAVTGTIPSIEAWETDLRALRMAYDGKGKGRGKRKPKPDRLVRMGVCPIRLYKIVHPEPQQKNVMNHIGAPKEESHVTRHNPKLKKYFSLFRKFLGLKECPSPTDPVEYMQPDQSSKAVAVIPIGTKKDIYNDAEVELL